jgi:hypothetical protein
LVVDQSKEESDNVAVLESIPGGPEVGLILVAKATNYKKVVLVRSNTPPQFLVYIPALEDPKADGGGKTG